MTTLDVTKKTLEELIDKKVDARVQALKRLMVPHHCFTCKWFILRTEKPRNRVCRCPDNLEATKSGACKNWEIQEDSGKWVVNKNMSV